MTRPNPDPSPACPTGFHGSGCQRVCECQQGAPCDPVSGQCLCPAGFHGQFCERGECLRPPPHPCALPSLSWLIWGKGTLIPWPLPGCKPGFFGNGCLQQCSCPTGVPCDPSSGLCLCPPGRTGATCDLGECGFLPRTGHRGRATLTANINHVGWLPACQASD